MAAGKSHSQNAHARTAQRFRPHAGRCIHPAPGEVSDRQWRDVLGVLKTRTGELELDYLRKWAKELNVGDLLERALKEA
jgi:hypothetical protein